MFAIILANQDYREPVVTLGDFELGRLDRANFLGE